MDVAARKKLEFLLHPLPLGEGPFRRRLELHSQPGIPCRRVLLAIVLDRQFLDAPAAAKLIYVLVGKFDLGLHVAKKVKRMRKKFWSVGWNRKPLVVDSKARRA